MPDVTLRPARGGDAPAIAAIWAHWAATSTATFTTDPPGVRAVATLIAERPVFLVAEAGAEGADGICGYATYAPFRAGPGYARTMEHSIHLAPERRGQGIGAALLTGIEDHAIRAGQRSLIGGLSAENAAAHAFHLRHGFLEAGRLRDAGHKFDRWIDLILMQKMLPRAA
ncbi:phosphinothricin acetyltransferase [Roseivivax lentus]|uniref:Phosphinothricin acetyltransferase n=1 Tax=Roseivivax lentus TaxID=633194 RepID=A0A1N7LYZ7_9RHOB|nr:GNAT family N-acetyltransferase [Roseivivax lentus]SIS78989.1 phosphinothricin acetyltransferase [Roseivivax lentus]